MFLFSSLSIFSILAFIGVVVFLVVMNELARANKYIAMVLFFIVPLVLTFTVWIYTATKPNTTISSWFAWVKVYSALAGCLGFLALRFIKGASANKYFLMFPAIILAVNIFEAVIRDFQCSGFQGYIDGVFMVGGPWNIINGIAGIINIITITGWMGIYIDSKSKKKDMLWPDQLWFWIIAYDLWNFAYVYNCISDHSFYTGAALLASATIAAFFIKKGAWLQHRAQTLAVWVMFCMTFPQFFEIKEIQVQSSHNIVALWLVSGIALLANIAVLGYYIYKLIKTKRNPLKEEIFTDLNAYKEVAPLK